MPKYDKILKPGEEIPEEFRRIVSEHFDEKNIEKLKRFGGRIQVSLTAPYTDRKLQKKTNIVIDEELISQLTISPEETAEILSKMTMKQIKALAQFINFPLASSTTVEQARGQVLSYLFSDETWKKISR
jgi:hypothetical protein